MVVWVIIVVAGGVVSDGVLENRDEIPTYGKRSPYSGQVV